MKIEINLRILTKTMEIAEFCMLVIMGVLGLGEAIGTEIEPLDPITVSWQVMMLDVIVFWLVLGRLRHSLEKIGDKEDAEE